MTIETPAPRPAKVGGKLKALMSKRFLRVPILYWTAGAVLILAVVAWRMKPANEGGKPEVADTGEATGFDEYGNPLPGTGLTGGGGSFSGGLSTGAIDGGQVGTPSLPGTSPIPTAPPPATDVAAFTTGAQSEEIIIDERTPDQMNSEYIDNAVSEYMARGYSEEQIRSYLGDYLAGRDMSTSAALFVNKVLQEKGAPPRPPAKVGKTLSTPAPAPAPKVTTKTAAVKTPYQTHIANIAAQLANKSLNVTAAVNQYGRAAVTEAQATYPAASKATAAPVKAVSPIATSKTITAPKVAAPTAHQTHIANVAASLTDGMTVTSAVAKYGRTAVTEAQAKYPAASKATAKKK